MPTASGEDSTFTNGGFPWGEVSAWLSPRHPPESVVPEAVDLGSSSSIDPLISSRFLGLETMPPGSTERVFVSGRAFGNFCKDSIPALESNLHAPFASGNAAGYEACEVECCSVVLSEVSEPILAFRCLEVLCWEKKVGLTPAGL